LLNEPKRKTDLQFDIEQLQILKKKDERLTHILFVIIIILQIALEMKITG